MFAYYHSINNDQHDQWSIYQCHIFGYVPTGSFGYRILFKIRLKIFLLLPWRRSRILLMYIILHCLEMQMFLYNTINLNYKIPMFNEFLPVVSCSQNNLVSPLHTLWKLTLVFIDDKWHESIVFLMKCVKCDICEWDLVVVYF